jgi:FlaA1/EpsC-like NDP-sugar epimerase
MYNKTVLIIGGTGTLGTALIDVILPMNPHVIRIFSRNEHKQFLLRQKYGEPYGNSKFRYFIGDIRDKERLKMAFNGVDIAINCAAIKHVSLAEENPFEAVKTNIIGVQNALECAVENNIECFLQISTDKSVNPVNLYGCTKAVAEYLTLDTVNWQGYNKTRFIVVRSGNIMASSGSVFEIWDNQKKCGKPLTVTDMNAVRYMTTAENIAKSVISIADNQPTGLYVLDMPKYKLSELINKYYHDCSIEVTGLKKGEKLYEELYRNDESFTLWEVKNDG